ncbi:hypothetical protein HYQ45_015770 [Verticillium longisporum]|uniref:Uncharacterized protein n=1 Tax=Verticillium longisporum TaxID=100787 RepID=A0A8I2ZA55_VERLO|nr:hypothetical protein HYQ45_015770 [Verticillium longisporum]
MSTPERKQLTRGFVHLIALRWRGVGVLGVLYLRAHKKASPPMLCEYAATAITPPPTLTKRRTTTLTKRRTTTLTKRLIVDHGRARHGPCTCLFGHSASPRAPEADGGRSAIPSMSNP